MERTDERDVKPSLPGQYVTLKMAMKDGVHQPRQYSVTRADDGQHRHLQAVRSDLIAKGVPAKDIQYEVFGPDLWLADLQ